MHIVFILISYLFSNAIADVTQGEFDVLLNCAKLSAIAYCLKAGLSEGKMSDSCTLSYCHSTELSEIEILEIFNFNEWGGLGSGYLAIDHKHGRIILTMRGTSSRRDWFGNFDFKPVPYNPISKRTSDKTKGEIVSSQCLDCRVHRGFYNFLLTKCAGIIKRAFKVSTNNPDYKLVVTGHSLGAALALLAGIEFQLLGLDPTVVTFASPRVGDASFTSWVDNNVFHSSEILEQVRESHTIDSGYFRVVHDGDFVPLIPPAPVYRQAGIVYRITKKEPPQGKEDIYLKTPTEEDASEDEVFIESPSKLWPPFLGKEEHKYYLIRITGCSDDEV